MRATRRAVTAALLVAASIVPAAAFDYPFKAGDGVRRVHDIAPPAGFRRVAVPDASFAAYLRHAPLMPAGTPVRRHDGADVTPRAGVVAVLDMPLLNATQQCADSALRYWFEYLREAGCEDAIEAKLTSGEPVRFAEWKARPRAGEGREGAYRRFLAHCMNYVGSFSLNRDLPAVRRAELRPGDLIVQPNPRGGVGHLSFVADAAVDDAGHAAFLVAYGWLPAQSVFIARPDPGMGVPAAAGGAVWFTLAGFEEQHGYLGANYTYRRFETPCRAPAPR